MYRNDEITIKEARKLKPEYLVISPGPCAPKQAGVSLEIIKNLEHDLPILEFVSDIKLLVRLLVEIL